MSLTPFCCLQRLLALQNKAIHGQLPLNSIQMAAQIKKIHRELFNTWRITEKALNKLEIWVLPPTNSLTIDFDVAVPESFSMIAAICQESDGNEIGNYTVLNQNHNRDW